MKRAENQPECTISLYAGIYAKAYTIKDEGTLLPQHSHHHSHLTALTAGAVRVWCSDGLVGEFTAPAFIKIEAEMRHSFLTLTPNVSLMCLHAVGAAEAVEDADLIHEEHHLELEA